MKKLSDLYRVTKEYFSTLSRPDPWVREALGAGEPAWTGETISPEGALNVSSVAACVRLLSESVAALPLHVYRRTEASKERASSHPLYSILHDGPNPIQSSYAWRQQAMAHVLLHGNAFSEIDRDGAGRVRALWPMLPQHVTFKSEDSEIVYGHWTGRGERRTLRAQDVLHLRGFSLDGITGISVISMARQGIALATAEAQHGASVFKNRAQIGLLLKTPSALSPEARERMAVWLKQFEGARQAGRSVVLEGGLEVAQTAMSNDDAQYLQSRQFSVQEIARWFRVPAHLIGDPTRLAYASAEVEMLAFLTHSLMPWLVNIESEINLRLLPDRTQFFAEFDTAGIVRGDLAARYSAYEKGLKAGFLSIADVRRAENLPYVAGTDELKPISLTKSVLRNNDGAIMGLEQRG